MLNKPTYGSQSIKTAEEILDRIFDERDYYDRHRILKAMREYADQHNFNHHPLSPEDIERAASKYAFENNTHRSNSKAFITGANFAKQPHSNESNYPIEFIMWYSGQPSDKINKAYQRYLNELPQPPKK